MNEPQSIPVAEIIDALQREGWVAAADGLREITDHQSRTLMCRVDRRLPHQTAALEEIIGHLGAADAQHAPGDDPIIAGHVRDALAIARRTLTLCDLNTEDAQ